jgi:UDPglucose 6-dehydrogenase
MGSDRRIGHHFLFPGTGYGGSCFPKDVQAIIRTAHDSGMEFPLLNAVEVVNERQKQLLVEKVVKKYGQKLQGRCFSVWGLAFKPRTDDMREAPSIVIIEELLKRGARIEAHDPEALGEARKIFGDRINYHRVNYDALQGADALLVVTDWNEFRRPDFSRMKSLMKSPIIFDGRNLYEHDVLRAQGFAYYPIGRAAVEASAKEQR